MDTELESIGLENWVNEAISVRDSLKNEIQTTSGFWKKLREHRQETELKNSIQNLISDFKRNCPADNVDNGIDVLATKIWELNQEFSLKLAWNLHDEILNAGPDLLENKPMLSRIQSFLKREDISHEASYRLIGICQSLVYSSISQGNKSNAGSAGEELVEAIFSLAGAEKGKHYRTQYKSNAGSDTDFVIPAVNDYNDSQVEVLIAAQMSTNDRARLASSELKTGGFKIMFSGNGLQASSKNLTDIGDQIIHGLKEQNVRLVCFGPELEKERSRLANITSAFKFKTELSANESAKLKRLEYFNNWTMNYKEFLDKIGKWCGTKSA